MRRKQCLLISQCILEHSSEVFSGLKKKKKEEQSHLKGQVNLFVRTCFLDS